MSKPTGYHEGDRSESLAKFAFSAIGFCCPVERQADYFKTDFFVHLASLDEPNLIATGLAFAAQAKSTTENLKVEGSENLTLFLKSALPYFICVCDKKTFTVKVYTTIQRLSLPFGFNSELTLIFEQEPDDKKANAKNTNATSDLHLGIPIADIQLNELQNDVGKRRQFGRVMATWTLHEQLMLAWRRAYWPIVGIPNYSTPNTPVELKDLDWVTIASSENPTNHLRSLTLLAFGFNKYIETLDKAILGKEVGIELRKKIRLLAELTDAMSVEPDNVDPKGI